ncbi:hypothetical protein MANES_15G176648v8 [Manihot esculenta]|uniref:Uncharacterized protein n=1 Tax=Manihot esculenta TaxID=3983 RepID=A0ACB7GEM8_MANES|nr:hypothetical protein MANES_15G176648v8 [Manihot esculenta]
MASALATLINFSPMSNLTNQIPLKLTSINFLLWKLQFLPMLRGCALEHHIDGSQPAPMKLLSENQSNPAYSLWVRQDQMVFRWIIACILDSIIPQIVGVETAKEA